MPYTAERELARLRARFEHEARKLAETGFLLRGSILERYSRCGSAGCACHVDPQRRHGPYWQWTRKVKGKTVTRNLSDDQVERYRQWIENGKRFDRIVAELHELSAQAEAIVRELEREPQEQKRKTQRRSAS